MNEIGQVGNTLPMYARRELTAKMRAGSRWWVPRAACRGTDNPNAFDVTDGCEEAATFCRVCPVRKECLDLMLSHSDFEGVAGGYAIRKRNGKLYYMYDIVNRRLVRRSRRDNREDES